MNEMLDVAIQVLISVVLGLVVYTLIGWIKDLTKYKK